MFILSIMIMANALVIPTFSIVHEQINGLLSTGDATSVIPSERFTDNLQAKCKQT